jgi:hypothetical protein
MPSITCGHCGQTHHSVEEVYYCSPQGREEITAQMNAEYAAEMANERYFEEGSEAEQMLRMDEADAEARLFGYAS